MFTYLCIESEHLILIRLPQTNVGQFCWEWPLSTTRVATTCKFMLLQEQNSDAHVSCVCVLFLCLRVLCDSSVVLLFVISQAGVIALTLVPWKQTQQMLLMTKLQWAIVNKLLICWLYIIVLFETLIRRTHEKLLSTGIMGSLKWGERRLRQTERREGKLFYYCSRAVRWRDYCLNVFSPIDSELQYCVTVC